MRMANYYRTTSNKKIGAILSKAVIFILAIYTLYLICLNIKAIKYNIVVFAKYTLLILSVFVIIYFVANHINKSPVVFAMVIFVLSVVAKSMLIFLTDTKPVSDFEIFYQYSIELVNGNTAFGDSLYFKTWAYQTGPVIYYAAIMKLFGTGLLPLKIVNCFFMAATNVLIYLIARKISNENSARAVSLLYLFYPAPYFLTTVLTNQHFAAGMFLLAIYIFLSERLNWAIKGIIAGVVIAFGNAVRPIGIIIIVASIIWGIIEIIRTHKYFKMCSIITLLISYLLVNYGCSAVVKYTGINSEGLVNNFPLWKFVVGLNYEAKGQFSYEDENNIYKIKDFDERNNVAKQVIKQRLSIGARQLAGLMNEKQKTMWAGTDTISWGFYKEIDGQLVASKEVKKFEAIILKLEKIYYVLIYILMLLGICKLLTDDEISQAISLLSLILLCYFGVHFLIEIQVRYRYFAVIIVFIMAAKGSEMLFSRCGAYRKNIRKVNYGNLIIK